ETLGTPARNGDYYDLDATDARGAKLRIRADALFGDVVSVTPAPHNWNGGGGARIIRVPVPQDRPVAQAEKSARHAAISRDVAVPEAVKPARPVKPDPMPPRRRPFSSNEPRNAEPVVPVEPALPKRTVLSAPPLPVEGPSPIRPLPRWRETNDTRPVEPASPAPAADGADPK
ncbi:MAG: hypothetical protein JO254_02990, partial [Pseudolabrys sp.]|nr:hypothetical protein [Pseudolabrys sp.]